MALSTASFTRRFNLHGMVIALSLAGAMLAVLPIVAGVVSGLTGQAGPHTAFASAPSGDYAVFARAGETADTIFVASPDNPEPMSVGVVPHLAGFPSSGAVSPDGRHVAFVVVDAGSPTAPGASLLVLDLESGELVRAALAIDHLQEPVWTPTGDALLVTRGGDAAPGPVALIRVNADGSAESEVGRVQDALGLYPVGFDPSGRAVSVLIDNRGSTLLRDGSELQTFSANISRDWALSPDGASLAFVDTLLDDGARYEARVVSVEPGAQGTFSAQSLAGGPQALGVTWDPSSGEPIFGTEPAAGIDSAGDATAQTLAAGFDIPLGFAASGGAMAVQHWTGDGFDNPGSASFEVVSGGTRLPLPGATGFFGWSAR